MNAVLLFSFNAIGTSSQGNRWSGITFRIGVCVCVCAVCVCGEVQCGCVCACMRACVCACVNTVVLPSA